jgi:CubicO group peptidase (beta-lactamase class C family)
LTTSNPSRTTDLQCEIDALVERATAARHVHALVLAVRSDDGRVDIGSAAGGAAPGDSYFVASIAKMFTATIVMQLSDEGRLELDSPIRNELPDVDLNGIHTHKGHDHSDRVTVRHLLQHTSGLPDYFAGQLQDDLAQNRDRAYTLNDVLDVARANDAEFPPGDRNGTRSSYCDTNYQLLSTIIEQATGASLAENLETRITEPLGLTDTYLYDPGRAAGRPAPLPLRHRDRLLSLPLTLSSERGAGGIVSTAPDQVRFLRAFHGGELFAPSNLKQMQRWNRIFFPLEYGYGLMRYRLPRVLTPFGASPELIGHSGVTGSFSFSAPAEGLHIAGTFNQLDKPSRPYAFMSKVARTAIRHLHD